MKISRCHEGHLGLVFSLCMLVSACNPEEYPTEELVQGADSFCAEAKDLSSCQQKADICQPAFEELEIDLNEPVFAACVANPDMWNPVYETQGEGNGTTPVEVVKDCAGVDDQYQWTVNEVRNKEVVKTTRKVKICHFSGNSRAHTIIIACPADKSHVKHHDDYIGACEL